MKMMRKLVVAAMLATGVSGLTAGMAVTPAAAQSAQEVVWVQIEAHPSLATATSRARDYAGAIEDVNGFALGGGWYGIALGPYAREDAEQVLSVYRADGLIPRDAYIAESSDYRQQFWPLGANVLNRGVVDAPDAVASSTETQTDTQITTAETATETTAEAAPLPTPEPADETPTEARRSEQLLTRDERMELQMMLKWAGFYEAAIDGAFGRGTRNSMAAWQEANAFDVTGILTTLQRATLKKQYNAVLDGLGLERVVDAEAGIELMLPTKVVSFDRYEPPFAHYDATGDVPAKVLLISQRGDQDTLNGLYDIMQTLEIVPLEGPRERRNNDFVLIGENGMMVSETRATLQDGKIKGFTLIWPAGDEERRRRLIGEMDKSFIRLEAALDPSAGDGGTQAIDLVAGLDVRKPRIARSGFYVDNSGLVITTSEAVQSCTRLTIDDEHEADVVADDATSGIAVVRPQETLAPLSVAQFSAAPPRLQSEVAVAGYSYDGVLSAPSMTFGKLADVRGLQGETGLYRLAMTTLSGDAGGPVFDATGSVMGMLLPKSGGARALPDEVVFAADTGVIRTVLAGAGVSIQAAASTGPSEPEDITEQAVGMTVLVSCWD
ncbi:trypsin-like peptidase domain protein [Pseudosulfitobacter pseudonitzschiae]|uniref:Trypsin-like peptidase domain protein n=2 Tax=Rhodobacterales TaxID=204455 RepID=A0A221JYF8_9RHOB|nr:trypsin-like peptidase domain protein [Pseudosulfitobacter pseudonitzschiae]